VDKPTGETQPKPINDAPKREGDKGLKRELGGMDHAAAEDRLKPGSVPESTPKSTPVDDEELRRRADATVDDIRTSAEGFRVRIASLVGAFAAPPTYEQMQQLDAVLRSFEGEIGRWRTLAMQVDQRLLAKTTPEWTGPDLLRRALEDLRDVFKDAVGAFQKTVDQRNDTEIRREVALTSKPRPQRGQPDERMRNDAGKEPLGDRDWAPLYVPGLRIARNAQTNHTPTKGNARNPEQIKSAVIHTGGKTNQGTLNTLTANNLAGHFSVDGSGATEQTNPVSQIGAHAEVANKSSIAIDLAYAPGASSEANAQLAFLESTQQMLSAARILVAQDRVSPDVIGRNNTRGATLGDHLDAARYMGGGFGTVMEVSGAKRPGMADDISGTVAHKELPDGDHADPGPMYMARLRAFLPVLQEYERRYGPIDVKDPKELERVVSVIERYEVITGRSAAGISIRDANLRAKVEIAMLEAKRTKDHKEPVGEADRQAIYDEVYSKLIDEMMAKVDPKDLKERKRTVREQVAAELPDADIHFDESVDGKKIVFDYIEPLVEVPADTKKEDREKYIWEHATSDQLARARNLGSYTKLEAAYPPIVRERIVGAIVRDRELKKTMDDNLAAFREYLAQHLPELIKE